MHQAAEINTADAAKSERPQYQQNQNYCPKHFSIPLYYFNNYFALARLPPDAFFAGAFALAAPPVDFALDVLAVFLALPVAAVLPFDEAFLAGADLAAIPALPEAEADLPAVLLPLALPPLALSDLTLSSFSPTAAATPSIAPAVAPFTTVS
jgi:hypothetical protein